MRKVKFRAKSAANNEWIYGAFQSSNPTCLFDTFPTGLPSEQILPETVGEYTDNLDFDGKYIFEGDILTNTLNDGLYKCGVVKFLNGTWSLVYFDGGFVNLRWALQHLQLAVTGNIHDESELTDVKQNFQ